MIELETSKTTSDIFTAEDLPIAHRLTALGGGIASWLNPTRLLVLIAAAAVGSALYHLLLLHTPSAAMSAATRGRGAAVNIGFLGNHTARSVSPRHPPLISSTPPQVPLAAPIPLPPLPATHIGFVGSHCGDKPLLDPRDFVAMCAGEAAEDASYGNTERSWWCAGMFPNASDTNKSHRICPFWEAGRFGAVPDPHAPPKRATLGRGVPPGPCEGLLNMTPATLGDLYDAHRLAATAADQPNATACAASHAVFGGVVPPGALWFNTSAYVRRPLGGGEGGGGGPTPATDDEEDLLVLRSRQCPHFVYLPSGGAAVAAVLYRHANPPLPAGASDAERRRGIVVHGDSMMRQLFLRLVASVRNDAFPLDRYFHSSALYTVTAGGDELLLFSPEGLLKFQGGPFSGRQRPSSSPHSRRLRIFCLLNEWFPGYLDAFLADEGHSTGGLGEGGNKRRASWRSLVAADARAALRTNSTAALSSATFATPPTFAEVRGLLALVYAAAYPPADPRASVLFVLKFLWEPRFPKTYYFVNTNATLVNKTCHNSSVGWGCNPDGTKVWLPSNPLVRYTNLALAVGGYHYWELGTFPAMAGFTGASREHLRRNKGQRQVIVNVPNLKYMKEPSRAVTNAASARWVKEAEAAASSNNDAASVGAPPRHPPRQRFLLDYASIMEASVNASVPHIPSGMTNTSMSVIKAMPRIIDNTHFMCGWLLYGGPAEVIRKNKQHRHAIPRPDSPRLADPDSPIVPVHFLRCRDPMNKALSQWLLQTLLRVEL